MTKGDFFNLTCSHIVQGIQICYIIVIKMFTLFDKQFPLKHSPYCSFNIFVPKAIDQWVYHGTHKDIENSYNFPLFYRCLRRRSQIHAEQCPIKHSDSRQVGPTGGESLVLP